MNFKKKIERRLKPEQIKNREEAGSIEAFANLFSAMTEQRKHHALRRNMEDFPKALDFYGECGMITAETNKKFSLLKIFE